METPNPQNVAPQGGNSAKAIGALALIAALTVAYQLLPLNDWFAGLRGQIHALGWAAPVAYVSLYILFSLLLIPPTALSLIAGGIFGWGWGVLWTLLGGNLGALLSFLLGRTLMRERVEEWARQRPRFAAIDTAIEENGFKVVLLVRLSPLFPFALSNYLLGITRVPLWKFAAATALGMPLITSIVVYIGSLPAEAAAAEWNSTRMWLHLFGLTVAILVAALVTVYARRAIEKKAN